jgi:hypothetical protein
MRPHKWIKSTLGHGGTMCEYCKGTNRELAAIGEMNHCARAPADGGETDARKYLDNGGLGETLGLAWAAMEAGAPKVQMDTDMAIALCQMAGEAANLQAERDAEREKVVWGFYEEDHPIYVQGSKGWHELTSEMTAVEANGLVAKIKDIGAATFQARVAPWMQECFGPQISADRLERGDRLLEEALELLQSGSYPRERIAALTDYVYGRTAGEPRQEAGGVMVTLAAYCLAHALDMHEAGEAELARISAPETVAKIRAKQAAKPTGSALPVAVSPAEPAGTTYDRLKFIEDECLDVRCHNVPTGGDDYEVAWTVIEHYMADPQERRIGYGDSPIEAIDEARQAIRLRYLPPAVDASDAPDHPICDLCQKPLLPGDMCLTDYTLGTVHAACCGPERESYVDLETGEPIKEGEPIPEPYVWTPDP